MPKASLENLVKEQRTPRAATINANPVGWWGTYDLQHWYGPFPTPERAKSTLLDEAPEDAERIHLLHVQAWEKREIRVGAVEMRRD
jgi:hypothetical protein